ncbi:MAG: hypothetical protein AAGC68_10275 [Verrucomicrobiota bacterium]
MKRLSLLLLSIPLFGSAQTDPAEPASPKAAGETVASATEERPFTRITPQDGAPTVRAIAALDSSNVFFLNHRGQIGIAKFSPGLSLIGWEFYSEMKLSALTALAIGPNYSILTASPVELTQSFDTDEDVELDFFQALVTDWPGREEGVAITAGPQAGPDGRILVALSPQAETEDTPAKAKLMAWLPSLEEPIVVTESQLQINAFTVSDEGLLAARLYLPNYEDGYYISLTRLPPLNPDEPTLPPSPIPSTLPSLLVPAELTGRKEPAQLAFFRESGREKLLAICPGSPQLIEIGHSENSGVWEGSILVRDVLSEPVATAVEMVPGRLLGGGDQGFVPLEIDPERFRIAALELIDEGIVIRFNEPIDRFAGSKPESYSVTSVSLTGGTTRLNVQPVIESDGLSVVLKMGSLPTQSVVRVVCQNVPSETGERLLSNAAFYTINR